jgi:hypothetical protein
MFNAMGLAGLQNPTPRPMGGQPAAQFPQMGQGMFGGQPGQFGGQNRQGFYDYLKSVGYTGEMGPDTRAYAQQLRQDGGHPRMDYRQSEYFTGPQMQPGMQPAGNPGVVPPAMGGSPVPQARAYGTGYGSGPGGLAALSAMRRPGMTIQR